MNSTIFVSLILAAVALASPVPTFREVHEERMNELAAGQARLAARHQAVEQDGSYFYRSQPYGSAEAYLRRPSESVSEMPAFEPFQNSVDFSRALTSQRSQAVSMDPYSTYQDWSKGDINVGEIPVSAVDNYRRTVRYDF
ncbi:hypothetical protein CBS101457_003470 [Exobasidium rhododendri]|nr:hypothetical protein CBS101457_003470 [Exobasidium rhododendri]